MDERQRSDWLKGRWIATRPLVGLIYVVRRQVNGRVEDRGTFPTLRKAQRWADKLNERD